MRCRGLFQEVCFVITESSFSASEKVSLECCLLDGGAQIATSIKDTSLTHIICTSNKYNKFISIRNERFVAIVTKEWVFKSFLSQALLPIDRFSANPSMFFSSLVIAPGKVEKDPRKVIDGLITHFGGKVVDGEELYQAATHILCSDKSTISNIKVKHHAFFAHTWKETEVLKECMSWREILRDKNIPSDFMISSATLSFLGSNAGIGIQYHVTYGWLEECVRKKNRVDEKPFVTLEKKNMTPDTPVQYVAVDKLGLQNIVNVYEGAKESLELALMKKISISKSTFSSSSPSQDVLSGAIVLLAQHIHPQLKQKVTETLKHRQAKVANVPMGPSYQEIVQKVVANASFVVCRYRCGFEYEEALRQKKRVVNIYWILGCKDEDAIEDNLRGVIYRPNKSFGGIPGMHGLVITLSGYSSRSRPSRDDIHIAIRATGACMLPVLSRTHSTHLLCYEPKGEKFNKALSWSFKHILNHNWVYQCLNQWKPVSENEFSWTLSSSKSTMDKDKENSIQEKPTSKSDTKPQAPLEVLAKAVCSTVIEASSRFDVNDVLSELDMNTPTRITFDTARHVLPVVQEHKTKEQSCAWFDTPSIARKQDSKPSTDSSPSVKLRLDFSKKEGSGEMLHIKNKVSTEEKELETDPDDTLVLNENEITLELAENDEDESEVRLEKPKSATTSKSTKVESSLKRGSSIDHQEPAKKSKTKDGAPKKIPNKKQHLEEESKVPTLAKVFLLTGSHEESTINESIIINLGATVCKSGRSFDPSCTHVICSELKRTEKFVAGCAGGKWILKPSYLEASSIAGKFVDEKDHEWGNSLTDKTFMDPRIWPKAPSFWREERSKGSTGAFENWNFFVHPKSVPPPDMCKKIIEAAGGIVITLDKKMNMSTFQSTNRSEKLFAVVAQGITTRDSWAKKFKHHKIQCINAGFLIDYITKDQSNPPQISDYLM